MISDKAITELMIFARSTAEQAGERANRYFRRPLAIEDKDSVEYFDPVTEADREVETFIRKAIESSFPKHGIIGEEHGDTNPASDIQWVIDPIDGTRAFISGVPTWGILMGLTQNGQCLGGLMHQPFTGETFLADSYEARLYYRGDTEPEQAVPLSSSGVERIEDATLYCTHPFMFPTDAQREAFESLAGLARLQRYGGDCYSYCMLAMGCIDLVIEGLLQPYDIVPLIPVIERAGGVVTGLDGNLPTSGGTVIAAATPRLHAEALAIMQASF
jgi:histidinol-phosphatase